MRRALPLLAATALLAAGFAVHAQDQNAPTQPAPQGHGMMGGGMIGDMMGNQEMMAQMTRMMENCNKMMESHLQDHHQGGEQQPDKKG